MATGQGPLEKQRLPHESAVKSNSPGPSPVCVSVGTHRLWWGTGVRGQWICSPLPPRFEVGSPGYLDHHLPDDSPVSTSLLTVGVLGSQTCSAVVSFYLRVWGIQVRLTGLHEKHLPMAPSHRPSF